jgi:ribonuclease BN (tRNA processing enzyme)
MKLIVLGSGTCVPSLKRSAPAYYLEAEGRRVLVDCGSGTLLQLEKANRSYKDIDAVFVTHTHPDHVSALSPLVHALLATPLFSRGKDLFLIGPGGFKKFYEKCIGSMMGKPKTFSIQIFELEDKMDYPPFNVFAVKTVHSESSIAYRFEYRDKSVVITGDADYDQRIVEFSRNTDLLIADCSFPESMKGRGHMTPKECGMIAGRAGVRKLLLSHLYSVDIPDEERIKECREVFDGDVSIAEDLLEINL